MHPPGHFLTVMVAYTNAWDKVLAEVKRTQCPLSIAVHATHIISCRFGF